LELPSDDGKGSSCFLIATHSLGEEWYHTIRVLVLGRDWCVSSSMAQRKGFYEL